MTCIEAREALLEADIEELRDGTSEPLAAHLASCAECTHAAQTIIAEMDVLRAALDTLGGTADAALSTSHTESPVVIPIARARSRRRTSFIAAAAGLACMAIGAVALQREIARRAGDSYPLHLPQAAATAGPAVNAAGGGAVAVIRTSNPKITVVWYLKPQRGKS
jgi:hypothetical protein